MNDKIKNYDKKLKIRFVKCEKALVMQILEQTGEFIDTEHVERADRPVLFRDRILLRGRDADYDLLPDPFIFDSNAKRDEYLAKVIGWITDEQFTNADELKVGEKCEFADDLDGVWCDGRLLFILPSRYSFRYIFATDVFIRGWSFAQYARPLARRIEPKIDGDVYTWEM